MKEITCFKAYDVRGRVPDQLNENIARRIGRAYAQIIKPKKVVVGHDIRLSSESIKAAVSGGTGDGTGGTSGPTVVSVNTATGEIEEH